MSVPTRSAQIRQIEVSVPVPVLIIPGDQIRETDGRILSDSVVEILTPLSERPGFIGFKAPFTTDLVELLDGPYAHLLFDEVTRDGIAEIGAYGQIQGPFGHWNRMVYVMGEESGVLEPIFEIPLGATEIWVCEYVTEAACGSLMSAFYSEPGGSREG